MDEQSFTTLFKLYEKSLYDKILPICKSEPFARDIIQDIFLKLWLNRLQFNEINDAGAYLFTMAENRVFTFLKKAARDKKLKLAVWNKSVSSVNVTEQQVLLKEFQQTFQAAVNELPPQRRIVYQMHKMHGMSYQQIASALGISTHTIKNQILHAAKQLKKTLARFQAL